MEKEQRFPPTHLPENVPESPSRCLSVVQLHLPCCCYSGAAETTASSGGLCPALGTCTRQEDLPFVKSLPLHQQKQQRKTSQKAALETAKPKSSLVTKLHLFLTHLCSNTSESPRSPVVSVLPALGFFLIYLELAASHQLLYSLRHDI